MTALLLDTTLLIDAERFGGDLKSMMHDADEVAIAAITVAELRIGMELAGSANRPVRQAFVDTVVTMMIPVIDYDVGVAETHAGLLGAVRRQGRPRGAHDLIIAANARATARVVLTADATAFAVLPDVAIR